MSALILAAWWLRDLCYAAVEQFDNLRFTAVERLTRRRRLRKQEEVRVLDGFDRLREEPDLDPTDDIAPLPVEEAQRERRLDLDIDTAYHARAEQWLHDIKTCAELEWQMYADDRDMRAWTLPLGLLPPRVPGALLCTLDRRVPGQALVGVKLPEVELSPVDTAIVERVAQRLRVVGYAEVTG